MVEKQDLNKYLISAYYGVFSFFVAKTLGWVWEKCYSLEETAPWFFSGSFFHEKIIIDATMFLWIFSTIFASFKVELKILRILHFLGFFLYLSIAGYQLTPYYGIGLAMSFILIFYDPKKPERFGDLKLWWISLLLFGLENLFWLFRLIITKFKGRGGYHFGPTYSPLFPESLTSGAMEGVYSWLIIILYIAIFVLVGALAYKRRITSVIYTILIFVALIFILTFQTYRISLLSFLVFSCGWYVWRSQEDLLIANSR